MSLFVTLPLTQLASANITDLPSPPPPPPPPQQSNSSASGSATQHPLTPANETIADVVRSLLTKCSTIINKASPYRTEKVLGGIKMATSTVCTFDILSAAAVTTAPTAPDPRNHVSRRSGATVFPGQPHSGPHKPVADPCIPEERIEWIRQVETGLMSLHRKQPGILALLCLLLLLLLGIVVFALLCRATLFLARCDAKRKQRRNNPNPHPRRRHPAEATADQNQTLVSLFGSLCCRQAANPEDRDDLSEPRNEIAPLASAECDDDGNNNNSGRTETSF